MYDDKHVVDGDCELLIELQHKLTSAAHFTSVWLYSEIWVMLSVAAMVLVVLAVHQMDHVLVKVVAKIQATIMSALVVVSELDSPCLCWYTISHLTSQYHISAQGFSDVVSGEWTNRENWNVYSSTLTLCSVEWVFAVAQACVKNTALFTSYARPDTWPLQEILPSSFQVRCQW